MNKILILLVFFLQFITGVTVNSQISVDTNYQPYSQGFESSTFPPTGWRSVNVSGNVIWMIGFIAHSGAQSAVCAWQQTGVGEDWLITPRWNILSGDSLTFWLRPFFVGFQPDSLAVRVSTTDSNLSSFNIRILYLAEGNGYPTTTTYQRYSVSLNQFAGQGIFIAFKHMNLNGDGIFIDDVSIERPVILGISTINQNPGKFELFQNYPNPFNPMTNIEFNIPKSANVKIIVNDLLGRELVELANLNYSAGRHNVSFDGKNYPSGIYFYTMYLDGAKFETKKMILIK